MVQVTSGILGAVAATLAFGAVHLEVAAGNDLLGPRGLGSLQQSADTIATDTIASSVNRSGKSDRDGSPASIESITLSYGLPGVPATSIMMRVPMRGVATSSSDNSQAKDIKPRNPRMVACEPSVSVLSSAARQIQSARCLT